MTHHEQQLQGVRIPSFSLKSILTRQSRVLTRRNGALFVFFLHSVRRDWGAVLPVLQTLNSEMLLMLMQCISESKMTTNNQITIFESFDWPWTMNRVGPDIDTSYQLYWLWKTEAVSLGHTVIICCDRAAPTIFYFILELAYFKLRFVWEVYTISFGFSLACKQLYLHQGITKEYKGQM